MHCGRNCPAAASALLGWARAAQHTSLWPPPFPMLPGVAQEEEQPLEVGGVQQYPGDCGCTRSCAYWPGPLVGAGGSMGWAALGGTGQGSAPCGSLQKQPQAGSNQLASWIWPTGYILLTPALWYIKSGQKLLLKLLPLTEVITSNQQLCQCTGMSNVCRLECIVLYLSLSANSTKVPDLHSLPSCFLFTVSILH